MSSESDDIFRSLENPGTLFTYILILCAVLNLPSGSIPCNLTNLQTSYGKDSCGCFVLNKQIEGWVIGIMYWVIAATVVFVAPDPAKAKMWILISLATHVISLLFMALMPISWGPWWLVLARAGTGIGAAIVEVFVPVWIMSKAPKQKQTIWIGFFQITVPLGVVVGYAIGIVFEYLSFAQPDGYWPDGTKTIFSIASWRFPMLLAAGIETLFLLGCFVVPSYILTVKPTQSSEDEPSAASWSEMLTKPVFMTYILLICCLIYIVSGLQNWGTDYLEFIFGHEKAYVIRLAFLIISVTGPLSGTLVGGWNGSHFANPEKYSGPDLAYRRILTIGVPGILASALAMTMSFIEKSWGFLIVGLLLWAIMFLGGMVFPVGIAALFDDAGKRNHVKSSMTYLTMTNIFGFGLSGILAGMVADRCGTEVERQVYGWRVTMFAAIPATIFLFVNYEIIIQRKRDYELRVIFEDADESPYNRRNFDPLEVRLSGPPASTEML